MYPSKAREMPPRSFSSAPLRSMDNGNGNDNDMDSDIGSVVNSLPFSSPSRPPSSSNVGLVSTKVWDVRSSPPAESLRGHLLPKIVTPNRTRRISIDTYCSTIEKQEDDKPAWTNQENITRSARSLRTTSWRSFKKQPPVPPSPEREYTFYLRILYPRSKMGRKLKSDPHYELSDDASLSTVGFRGVEDQSSVNSPVGGGNDNPNNGVYAATMTSPGLSSPSSSPDRCWVEKYKYPLNRVTVSKRAKNVCDLVTSHPGTKKSGTRHLYFHDEREADALCRYVEDCRRKQQSQSRKTMRKALAGTDIVGPGEQMTFLLEIVSAVDLATGDITSSDPFVLVRFGSEEIHKTGFIIKTLNPIWTVSTGSLCLFTCSMQKLFEHNEGLCFEVRDYDAMKKGTSLGAVYVSPTLLIQSNGERMEFDIKPLPGMKLGQGVLAIRCRRATPRDIKFMEQYNEKRKKQGIGLTSLLSSKKKGQDKQNDEHKIDHSNDKLKQKVKIVEALTGPKNTRTEAVDGYETKQYRVRPYPDPANPKATEWLSIKQLSRQVKSESRSWVEAGQGGLGRAYVEILNCEGLPNKDTGKFGNKTDTFVGLVYEDVYAQTDVISDCLSPMWMPWCQRAFVFHMIHMSSRLFVGVFDYDEGFIDNHDLIGRCAVDFTNFTPRTDYVLKYDLFTSGSVSDRRAYGTITIRLRFELEDARQAIFSVLKPPPSVHVNVKTKKDHFVIKNNIKGNVDMQNYSMTNINSYIEEILSYRHLILPIQDGLITLLLWRPTNKLTITSRITIPIPLHSLNAFITGITVVEHPSLIPSVSLFCIAWFLLTTMGLRHNDPNPWNRCKSFGEIFQTLVLGKSPTAPPTIAAKENFEEIMKWTKQWKERIVKVDQKAKKYAETNLELQEEHMKEMEDIGDTAIANKKSSLSMDPLKPILFPIQQNLSILCEVLRLVKNIVIWEECYYSFWLTLTCIALGVACLFIPWRFCILWSSRILVWVLFGPWMKLIDIFYYRKLEQLTDEELQAQIEQNKNRQAEAYRLIAKQARIDKENAKKVKAMKKYLFGRFISEVPILKTDRFRDTPLPDSTATPHRPRKFTVAELAMYEAGTNRIKIPGQSLKGDMIPMTEENSFTDAPQGQVVKHASVLQIRGSKTDGVGNDTNSSPTGQISSIILVSVMLTWFGVPAIISTVKWIMDSIIEWTVA